MFKRIADTPSKTVTINLDGRDVSVPAGETIAASVLAEGIGHSRTTPVSNSPRAPYCLMGVCFECQMEIDGVPNRQACMTQAREGMVVKRQQGPSGVKP
jgi:D-hydroxyproline dehydrogenase subunit gamma